MSFTSYLLCKGHNHENIEKSSKNKKATNEIHKSKCTKTKGLVDCRVVESLKGNFPRGQ